MTPVEAHWCAQAYAWAREDQGAADGVIVRTASPEGTSAGSFAFAEAYAAGWAEYNAGARYSMIPVQDAWEHWQASGAVSVFRPGDSTAEQQARARDYRARPGVA